VPGKLVAGAPSVIDAYVAKVNTVAAVLAAVGHLEEAIKYSKTVDTQKAMIRLLNPIEPLTRQPFPYRDMEFVEYSDTYGEIVDYDHPNNYRGGMYEYVGADDYCAVVSRLRYRWGLPFRGMVATHIDRLSSGAGITALWGLIGAIIELGIALAIGGGPPGWVAALAMIIAGVVIALLRWLTYAIAADEMGCIWVFHRCSILGTSAAPEIWFDVKIGAGWWLRTIFATGIVRVPTHVISFDGIHIAAGDPGYEYDY